MNSDEDTLLMQVDELHSYLVNELDKIKDKKPEEVRALISCLATLTTVSLSFFRSQTRCDFCAAIAIAYLRALASSPRLTLASRMRTSVPTWRVDGRNLNRACTSPK